MSTYETWSAMEDFMASGGDVLWWIALLLFAMWTLIIERFWYARTEHKRVLERATTVKAPFSTTTLPHVRAISTAMPTRSSCIAAVEAPASRAISPG